MKTIHLEGKLKKDEDGMQLADEYVSVARMVADKIDSDTHSKHEEDEYNTDISVYAPNVFFRFYVSDAKCTLEEAEKGYVEKILGSLDIYSTWYGYSEYTIEGYNIENFTVGNHDIEKILESYDGKYIHILIDVK